MHFHLLIGFPNVCSLTDSFLLWLLWGFVVVYHLSICYEIPLPLCDQHPHCPSFSNACILLSAQDCETEMNQTWAFSHPKPCASERITIWCKGWKMYSVDLNNQGIFFFSQTSVVSQSRVCGNITMFLKTKIVPVFCCILFS